MGEASRAAVIVAAGSGRRMGEDKVWLELGGIPVVAHSVMAFNASLRGGCLVLVVREDRLADAQRLVQRLGLGAAVCCGGAERQDSVRCGLAAVGDAELVSIHDAARPLVSAQVIEVSFDIAEIHGAAVAAVPLRDTIKRAAGDTIVETLDRSALWAIQTPQTFRTALLRRAYNLLDRPVTDDAAAVELLGHPVKLVESDPTNFKLTTPEDMEMAKALMLLRRAAREVESGA